MRTELKEVKIYKFDELSDKAKENATQILAPNDYEWWDGIEEDARTIGLKLVDFDLYRSCTLEVMEDLHHTAKQILENHGKECDTYIAAEQYLNDEFIDDEFLQVLQEDYRIILEREYEYLCSETYIAELCDDNGWEFTEDGDLY